MPTLVETCHRGSLNFTWWRKEDLMEYTIPEVEVIGVGSELVQAFAGPHNDYGAQYLSLAATCASFEGE